MKASLIVAFAMTTIGFIGSDARSEVLNQNSNSVSLLEFSMKIPLSLEATGTNALSGIHCSSEEIENGAVKNKFTLSSYDGEKTTRNDENIRKMIPTDNPFEGKASWYVDNDKCLGLPAYVNGIGFESFDPDSGNAVMYVSNFDAKEIDRDKWSSSSAIARVSMMFNPELEQKNVNKFPATCERKYVGLLGALKIGASELFCTLIGEKGFVKFSIHES